MPATNWSKLSRQQLGAYAEYYAKMEFVFYGFHVYTSEIDDHGIDFIAEAPNGQLYNVQVKSVRGNTYTFILQDKIALDNNHLVCYLRLRDGERPEAYVIPATVWKNPNARFVRRDYDAPELKSKPEYGIQHSAKNRYLLEGYEAQSFLPALAETRE